MEVVDFVDGFVGYQSTLPAVSAQPKKPVRRGRIPFRHKPFARRPAMLHACCK
jgi:hypothetical protein